MTGAFFIKVKLGQVVTFLLLSAVTVV